MPTRLTVGKMNLEYQARQIRKALHLYQKFPRLIHKNSSQDAEDYIVKNRIFNISFAVIAVMIMVLMSGLVVTGQTMDISFLNDPEWEKIPDEDKPGVVGVYVDDFLESNPEWSSVPDSRKSNVRDYYINEIMNRYNQFKKSQDQLKKSGTIQSERTILPASREYNTQESAPQKNNSPIIVASISFVVLATFFSIVFFVLANSKKEKKVIKQKDHDLIPPKDIGYGGYPRGSLDMNKNKGKKWALNVLWLVVSFNGFKLLAGFSSADPGGAAAMALLTMIGGIIIFCPIAFAIGYFKKENKGDDSN